MKRNLSESGHHSRAPILLAVFINMGASSPDEGRAAVAAMCWFRWRRGWSREGRLIDVTVIHQPALDLSLRAAALAIRGEYRDCGSVDRGKAALARPAHVGPSAAPALLHGGGAPVKAHDSCVERDHQGQFPARRCPAIRRHVTSNYFDLCLYSTRVSINRIISPLLNYILKLKQKIKVKFRYYKRNYGSIHINILRDGFYSYITRRLVCYFIIQDLSICLRNNNLGHRCSHSMVCDM